MGGILRVELNVGVGVLVNWTQGTLVTTRRYRGILRGLLGGQNYHFDSGWAAVRGVDITLVGGAAVRAEHPF